VRLLCSQTTVGFGDLTPTTVAGKITAVVLTHFGILALALPITVRSVSKRCLCVAPAHLISVVRVAG